MGAGAVTEVWMREDSGLDKAVRCCGGRKGWTSERVWKSHQQNLLQVDWAWVRELEKNWI